MAGDGDGERLDVHLVRRGYAASRRVARALIAGGAVRVNGLPARKGTLVRSLDTVEVAPAPAAGSIQPNPELGLEVLFEDAALIVVNKPALMPCHPLRGDERDTVMNAVVARFPEVAALGDKPLEGGLVHRLDNGTSGALIIARQADAFARMRDAIRGGGVTRRYEALVAGELRRPLRLDSPIAHHPKSQRKMIVVAGGQARPRGARAALTMVEPIGRADGFTLVSVRPKTGSRHQIRVHLAAAGYPLAGDSLYGGPRIAALAPGRLWLHLRELEFESPASGRVKVEAPRPADLSAIPAR